MMLKSMNMFCLRRAMNRIFMLEAVKTFSHVRGEEDKDCKNPENPP